MLLVFSSLKSILGKIREIKMETQTDIYQRQIGSTNADLRMSIEKTSTTVFLIFSNPFITNMLLE